MLFICQKHESFFVHLTLMLIRLLSCQISHSMHYNVTSHLICSFFIIWLDLVYIIFMYVTYASFNLIYMYPQKICTQKYFSPIKPSNIIFEGAWSVHTKLFQTEHGLKKLKWLMMIEKSFSKTEKIKKDKSGRGHFLLFKLICNCSL